ncbi:MAG: CDP-glycerol glycerophosphotransferase family protein [Candidatus Cloacimonadales bacterium]|nr:CDP-glycerol glycerophosphotransferase family protein [Candidatus Cloacimonadales bacterium]
MKFLFYVSKQYSIPIIDPIVIYLTQTDHEFAFYISDKVYKILPVKWQKYKIFRETKNAKDFQPDFVLAPGNFMDFRLPGIKVQLFHGLAVEKPSHYKIRHFFDVYCTSGPFVTERFLTLKKKYKYFEVLETGWPKVDHILGYPVAELSKKAIPWEKKIILFAPTHSRKMESASELMKIIPLIIRKNEFWLIKFHELMNNESVNDFKLSLCGNAMIIHDSDITPYLHAADVLISDTSSVFYEFMLLNKPVISYKTQSRFDKGLNITDPSMLRDAIDWSLKNPQAHSEQRRAHLREINPYLDGKISERLIERLIENKDKLAKIKKPLNLFRKMQILYHERFKKGYLR